MHENAIDIEAHLGPWRMNKLKASTEYRDPSHELKDVPTCPFSVIDYELTKAEDADEVERLWKAAMETGFWYLMNHGVHEEAEGMFAMGEETIALTLKEKLLFEQGDQGVSFGYDKGTRDVPEFVNISKDDALACSAVARRTYPSAITPDGVHHHAFVKKSLAINNRLIGVLNDKLGLAAGALASVHKVEEFSGCMARFLRAPPYLGPEKTFLTAHTDFGSFLFLHNRLVRLSVAQPLPGHAICNIGDALNIISGGILPSNIHCVVQPPREQAQYERHSVVFLARRNDTAEPRALSAQSERIAAAVAKAPRGKYAPDVTAMEWLVRRVKSQRVTNCKVCPVPPVCAVAKG
ncbi:Clavaminate synthase-like protein [Epithele typhae]|uniref:Clavaminate synthase-like protein n=1 Tax=Epithele typhae TaxID=378194 RepID=UPI0020087C2C|nr:Clavaminate synthase-like protein [Epithele typhae]KAH9918546.1 Clavaminate synthase-like protein [Epithele typhae]